MKIVYTGVYRDRTGYSQAAIDNILSIEKAGFNIVCRPVGMSTSKIIQNSPVQHLENGDLKNVDTVIQHCLPHTFEKKINVKTIGIFDWETDTISPKWVDALNLIDEVWVPSIQNHHACLKSGVQVPIKLLPHSCDTNKYNKKSEPLDITLLKDKCVFYFIGENTRRKNIAALLRAYYASFTDKEDVVLVIKTSSGVSSIAPKQTSTLMEKFIVDIKNAIHIHKDARNYPPVIVITEYLSEEQLARLHASCTVFVSPSHGEGGNLPAMDAMGYGNPVILSNWGFHPELCYEQAKMYWEPQSGMFLNCGNINCGWLVPGQLTYCFGQISVEPEMYNGLNQWFDVSMTHFVGILRIAYSEWKNGTLNIKGTNAKERIKNFSHENLKPIIQELLK